MEKDTFMGMQSGTAMVKNWQFFSKLNLPLPYNPAMALLGIYPKVLKTYVHTKTCISMFIRSLFIDEAKTWKQPGCP